MTPENRSGLESVIEEIAALIPRLRQHDQPLAMQLLEMAIIEIKSQIHGIAEDEMQALVDTLTSGGPREKPLITEPSAQVVVSLDEISRNRRRRRN